MAEGNSEIERLADSIGFATIGEAEPTEGPEEINVRFNEFTELRRYLATHPEYRDVVEKYIKGEISLTMARKKSETFCVATILPAP